MQEANLFLEISVNQDGRDCLYIIMVGERDNAAVPHRLLFEIEMNVWLSWTGKLEEMIA